ncbi:MAG TPA: preprotein translocase subunit YajC, partial [Tianweitania sediminis]|nr:preprotein translocase subunit YajC [Tianweitania sediminis]
MFVTPAYAQSATGGAPEILMSILPFILIFIIMYFL